MEELKFVEASELSNWKGACIFMTCQHFSYESNQHRHTIVGCRIRRRQPPQGDHLIKKCQLWTPTWHQQVCWAPEAS